MRSGAFPRLGLAVDDTPVIPDVAGEQEFRTMANRIADRAAINIFYITPEDYGAVGNGSTDDSAAINSASAYAKSVGLPLKFSRKTYRFNSPIGETGDSISWIGEDTVLLYGGNSTTADMVVFGTPGSDVNNLDFRGFRIMTQTRMTAGWMLVLNAPARSTVADITLWGIDGKIHHPSGRPHGGLYVNGYSYLTLSNFEFDGSAFALNGSGVPTSTVINAAGVGLGLRGDPTYGQAGLFITGGFRIAGWNEGVVVGGANGGVYMSQGDVIGNTLVQLKMDDRYNSTSGQYNREVFVANTVSFDFGGSNGCVIIDQNGGNALMHFEGVWMCSSQGTKSAPTAATSGAALYIKRCENARIEANIYCHNNGGDAVRVDEPNADVLLKGFIFNNKGWGLNRTVANNRTSLDGVIFRDNDKGDIEPTHRCVITVQHDAARFDSITTQSQPLIRYGYVTGTTDATGFGYAPHNVGLMPTKILMTTAWYKDAAGASVSAQAYSDNTNVGIIGGGANRPFRIGYWYTIATVPW